VKIQLPNLKDIFLLSIVIGVGISYGDLYLFHIIFAIVILQSTRQLIFNSFKINLNAFQNNYIYFMPLFMFWYFITIFWSVNKLYTVQYIFYIFCGTGIVFYIVSAFKTPNDLNRGKKILACIFIIEIALSILESFSTFRLPISPFSDYVTLFGREPSLDPTLDSFSVASLIQPPTGFQWNPNDLALTMITLVPFFLFLNKNFLKWIAIFAITTIIIMTSSRSVFLSMGILFLIYFIFYKRQILPIAITISVSLLFFIQIENLKESENPQISEIANTFSTIQNILSDNILIGESISIREELARNGINALKNSYGFGVGAGGSVAIQEKLGGVDGRITSMHNFWLEVIVDSGVLFGIIFLIWYLSLTWNLYLVGLRSKLSHIKYFGKSISLSLIIFVPAAITSSSVIYFLPMWLLFGFAIATLEIESKITNQKNQQFP
jgi:teichuronic acid biosynthesis protein TuaE